MTAHKGIYIQGDRLYYNGFLMAEITAPPGTARGNFEDLIRELHDDGVHAPGDKSVSEQEADTRYDDGYEAGYRDGHREGSEETRAEIQRATERSVIGT